MNLSHLHYFKKLAEELNYTHAADALFISQPTLSLAITKLEGELGTQLFVRKKGRIELTENGEIFYQYASGALQMLDNGTNIVEERVGKVNDSIRIGAIYSSQSHQWSSLLRRFREMNSSTVHIDLKQTTTPGLIRALKKGTIDVGFGGYMDAGPIISFVPLWAQRACVIVNKENPLARKKALSLSDLSHEQIITYSLDAAQIGQLTKKLVEDKGLNVQYLYADEISLCAVVAANPSTLAIACHSWLVKSFLDEVVALPIEENRGAFRRLHMCYRSDTTKPQIVNDFIGLTHTYPFDDFE